MPGSQAINKSHSDSEIISSPAAHLSANTGELNPGQASPKIYISDSSNPGAVSFGGSSPQESPMKSMATCQIRSSDNVYLDSVPSSELGTLLNVISLNHEFYLNVIFRNVCLSVLKKKSPQI